MWQLFERGNRTTRWKSVRLLASSLDTARRTFLAGQHLSHFRGQNGANVAEPGHAIPDGPFLASVAGSQLAEALGKNSVSERRPSAGDAEKNGALVRYQSLRQSTRSAVTGSTLVARRAGKYAARRAANTRTAGAATKVRTSRG
jgi:hypothetical protein